MAEDHNIFLEDHLKRRQDYISNLQNSYHWNQTEINKHLFTLAIVSLGYNLTLIEDLSHLLTYLIWFASALFLTGTVISCFMVFRRTSELQIILIKIETDKFNESKDALDNLIT